MAQQPPSQPDGAVDLTLQDRRPSGRKPVHAFFPNDPDTAVIVPVADVHQLPLPPATADGNSAVADQPAGQQQQQQQQQQPAPALLCEPYAQTMRCDRGSACPFIHAVVENATRRTVHIRSDTWTSPSDVRYDMFDPGQPVKLSGPYHNFDETVDPGLCIRTAVEFTPVTVAALPATPESQEQEEGLLSATHCAHFLPKGVCHLGKVCKFVHMAFPSPGALQSVVRPPQPARAERNTTAPTPAGPRKSPQRPARGGGGAGGGDQPAVAPAPPSSRRGKSSSRVASRNSRTAATTSDSQPGGTTTASAVAAAAVPPPTVGGGSGVIPSKSSPQAASHPAPPPRRKQPPAVGGFIAHATHAGGTIPAVGLHQHPAAAGVPPMVALPLSPDAFHQQHPVPGMPLVPGPGPPPRLPAVGASMQPSAFPIAPFQPHMVATLPPSAAPGLGAPPMAHHLPSGPNTGGGVAPFIVPQFVPAGALPPTAALPPGATFVVYPPPQQTTTSSLPAASAQADPPPTTQHPGP